MTAFLAGHILHVSLLVVAALWAILGRKVRLPASVLPLFLVLIAIHWGEHIAQMIQIWVLHWSRPEAGGLLGLVFPVLVKQEYLHTAFSVIVLVGLLGFKHQFRGVALGVWIFALGFHLFHAFEHQLLFWQATVGTFLFGAKAPVSLIQAVLPAGLRPELHLFYNGVVTGSMLLGQALMTIGGDMHIFNAFYRLGRYHGHPPIPCALLAWRQARAHARPGYWRTAWAGQSWTVDTVRDVTRRLLDVWTESLPTDSLSFLDGVQGAVDQEEDRPNFTILTQWKVHDTTKERRPSRLAMIPTKGLLDMLEGLGPEMFTSALAAIAGHELAHVSLAIRQEDKGAWSGPEDQDTPRVEANEIDADLDGVRLAEQAGFPKAREAVLLALQGLLDLRGKPEDRRRIAALRAGV